MATTDLAARIVEWSDLAGPPGREDAVRNRIRASLPKWAEQVREDALGNLVAHVPRPEARRLLLLVPMDEPALALTFLDRRGRGSVAPLGPLRAHAIAGWRVTLPSGVRAAVGVRPPDPGAEEEPLGFERLYLDFGVRERAEVEAVVAVGDPAVPDVRTALLPGGAVCGKALGSRAACAAALLACELAGPAPSWDVTLAFVAQSLLAQRGVAPIAARSPADLVLSLGSAAAVEGARWRGGQVVLGKGAAVLVSDRGLLASGAALEALHAAAQRAGLSLQTAVADDGTTAAGPALAAGTGAPAGALAFPLRHRHTAAEVCAPADVAAVAAVLAALLALPGTAPDGAAHLPRRRERGTP